MSSTAPDSTAPATPLPGPLTLQPDLQYVINPAGDESIGHAVVAALRISVGF